MRPSPTKRSRLIVVSAPSGAGKTTLCEMLIREFRDRITLSISTTTRPRRPNEQEGVHYFFVSPEEFQRKIEHGDFVEWAEVHGNRYGSSKSTIERGLSEGKNVLFDIDVKGAMNLKNQYKDRVLLIFIHPPSMETLQQRLLERKGDSASAIERRLQNAYNELEWSRKFDHQITNDELNRAYQELRTIVMRECL